MTEEKDLVSFISENSKVLVPERTGLDPQIKKLEGIKAVIFDVYGTLIISGSGDISIASDPGKDDSIMKLADDSGLVVEALNGKPGIFSARYAGSVATDRQNNLKLLENMKGKKNRNAAFYCSVALSKPNGLILTYTGKCSGLILHEPVGTGGFGYDPLFFHPSLKKSFAQLSIEEKSRVSHRGQVMRKIENDFKKILIWLKDS